MEACIGFSLHPNWGVHFYGPGGLRDGSLKLGNAGWWSYVKQDELGAPDRGDTVKARAREPKKENWEMARKKLLAPRSMPKGTTMMSKARVDELEARRDILGCRGITQDALANTLAWSMGEEVRQHVAVPQRAQSQAIELPRATPPLATRSHRHDENLANANEIHDKSLAEATSRHRAKLDRLLEQGITALEGSVSLGHDAGVEARESFRKKILDFEKDSMGAYQAYSEARKAHYANFKKQQEASTNETHTLALKREIKESGGESSAKESLKRMQNEEKRKMEAAIETRRVRMDANMKSLLRLKEGSKTQLLVLVARLEKLHDVLSMKNLVANAREEFRKEAMNEEARRKAAERLHPLKPIGRSSSHSAVGRGSGGYPIVPDMKRVPSEATGVDSESVKEDEDLIEPPPYPWTGRQGNTDELALLNIIHFERKMKHKVPPSNPLHT